ncbi:MAG: glycosyltransferase family A protein [Acidimicrobiales bacterium]
MGRLLDATLRSVCRQTDPSFRVVIVHNERPPYTCTDERVTEVRVGFAPPSEERGPRIDFYAWRRDKGTKYVIGTIAARGLGADHVMLMDADDLVHQGLAAFANAQPSHAGWFSDTGYIHTHGSRNVQYMARDFHRKNGSTGIVRTDLTAIPESLSTRSSQEEILAAMTAEYVDRMFGEHGHWAEHLAPLGHVVEPLPFPAAVWEIGTGENVSGNLVSGRRSIRIDDAITTAFSLERPSMWSHLSTAASMGWHRALRKVERRRITPPVVSR